MAGYDGNSGNFNEFNAILAVSPTEIWAAGDYVNPSNRLLTLTDRLCMSVPTVTGVLPISGNTSGGTQVAISGTDFNFADLVSFGPTGTSFTINSDTQIIATVPPQSSPGTTPVFVRNPAGTSANTPACTFVYVPPAYQPRFDFPLRDDSAHLTHLDGALWARELEFISADLDWKIPFTRSK